MIVLHYLENSRAQRILWMLEELEVDYEVEVYKRDPKTDLAPPELAEIHPLGKSPVITDDDTVFAESGAIVEYLAETYGADRLVPDPDSEAHKPYRYFMHYAEGSLMPLLSMKFIFDAVKQKVPFFVKPVVGIVPNAITKIYLGPTLAKHVAFLDQHLASQEYFAGDQLTAADIQMSFPMETAADRLGGNLSNIRSFVERIQSRPAYQRALKAVPVDYLYG